MLTPAIKAWPSSRKPPFERARVTADGATDFRSSAPLPSARPTTAMSGVPLSATIVLLAFSVTTPRVAP